MASFKKEFGLVNSKISNASRHLKDLLKYLQNVMTPSEAEKIGGKRQLLIGQNVRRKSAIIIYTIKSY